MSEQKALSTRERWAAHILLVVAEIICGKSYEGGVDSDTKKLIADLRANIQ